MPAYDDIHELFFNTGLETTAVLSNTGGANKSVEVHFISEHESYNMKDHRFEAGKPSIMINQDDIDGIDIGSVVITIGSSDYKVTEPKRDSTKITLLILREHIVSEY